MNTLQGSLVGSLKYEEIELIGFLETHEAPLAASVKTIEIEEENVKNDR